MHTYMLYNISVTHMRALFCVAYPRVKFVYFWSMHSAIISLLPPPGVAWCMLSHLPPASTRCGMVYVVTPPSCLHQVWHGVCCHTSLLPPPGVTWCMLSHLPPASTRCDMVHVVTPPSCLHQVWHGACCHTSLLPPPGVAWYMLIPMS